MDYYMLELQKAIKRRLVDDPITYLHMLNYYTS